MEATLNLTGIPETMLWTLHNRASEAQRSDAWLKDDHAIRIYRSIQYDYQRSFGKPDGSHAIRSLVFDEAVHAWLSRHPGGTVVELACGLETQFQRIDDGQVQWYCVDLPDAIAVRERFLPPFERCRHIPKSALDLSWMDDVGTTGPIFVSMQGLLMYFEEEYVKTLLSAILARFPGSTLMFDVIPRWFSRKTLKGFRKTPHYQTPCMPWGINRDKIQRQLRDWGLPLATCTEEPYRKFRVFPWGMTPWFAKLPWLGTRLPAIVRIEGTPR
ncbi:MAG: class I SAM-dependent methyltransferase [Brachymonas sp.]